MEQHGRLLPRVEAQQNIAARRSRCGFVVTPARCPIGRRKCSAHLAVFSSGTTKPLQYLLRGILYVQKTTCSVGAVSSDVQFQPLAAEPCGPGPAPQIGITLGRFRMLPVLSEMEAAAGAQLPHQPRPLPKFSFTTVRSSQKRRRHSSSLETKQDCGPHPLRRRAAQGSPSRSRREHYVLPYACSLMAARPQRRRASDDDLAPRGSSTKDKNYTTASTPA